LIRKILLFVLYFALVTPIGLLITAVHDPLHRKINPRAHSYWIQSAK
jgi:hypothetical protein